jgi:hypothetical protein
VADVQINTLLAYMLAITYICTYTCMNEFIRTAEKCEAQLKDHTEELMYNDHLLLQSARELGTYRPEDLLLCLYRNPNDAVQMLLEALALMFGMV